MINFLPFLLLSFSVILFVVIIGGYCFYQQIEKQQSSQTDEKVLPWLFVSKLIFSWANTNEKTITFDQKLPFFNKKTINYQVFLNFFTKSSQSEVDSFFSYFQNSKKNYLSTKKLTVDLDLKTEKFRRCTLETIIKDKKTKTIIVSFSNIIRG